MADPAAATITQLKNIQSRTGKSIAELQDAVVASGAAKHGERRSWLMEHFKLGYGDANAVALFIGKPLPDLAGGAPASAPPATADNPLDTLYSGAKSALRPLHDAVMDRVRGFGPFDEAPKKAYVSLRRRKQFVMIGPATKDSVEIGLNADEVARVLAGNDYAADVQRDIAEARQVGATGVPFFVFNRKYAVSGAQESATFLEVLEKILSETGK